MPLFCFILPTVIPVVCWNETWMNAYFIPTVFRYVFTLNVTWLVNSAAHFYGNKPYDKYESQLKQSYDVFFFNLISFGKNNCQTLRSIFLKSLLDFLEIYFRDSVIITIAFLFGIGISIQQKTKALLYSPSAKVGTITIMFFPGTTRRPS